MSQELVGAIAILHARKKDLQRQIADVEQSLVVLQSLCTHMFLCTGTNSTTLKCRHCGLEKEEV